LLLERQEFENGLPLLDQGGESLLFRQLVCVVFLFARHSLLLFFVFFVTVSLPLTVFITLIFWLWGGDKLNYQGKKQNKNKNNIGKLERKLEMENWRRQRSQKEPKGAGAQRRPKGPKIEVQKGQHKRKSSMVSFRKKKKEEKVKNSCKTKKEKRKKEKEEEEEAMETQKET